MASQYALNKWLRPTKYTQAAIFTPLHSIGRGAVLGRHTKPLFHLSSTNILPSNGFIFYGIERFP